MKKGYYARQYVRICKYYNFKEDQQCNSRDKDNHITMEMFKCISRLDIVLKRTCIRLVDYNPKKKNKTSKNIH